jgi:hypothetical protein
MIHNRIPSSIDNADDSMRSRTPAHRFDALDRGLTIDHPKEAPQVTIIGWATPTM